MLRVFAMGKNHQLQELYQIITILILVNVFTYSKVHAQDTLITHHNFPEFVVSEKLDRMFSEINTHKLDSDILEINSISSLSILLSKNSGVTVKSYGVSGLSSVSMRGGNSNHTAVLWNGFNLQDPLNGGYNFSSSGANLIEDVTIQYGGGSSVFGSGAIGGIIHLNNKPAFNKQLFGEIEYKTGSFGLQALNTKVGFGNRKLSTSIRFFKHTMKNDFNFINVSKAEKPIERYINSSIEQYGLLHELYYKIKKNQLLSSQFWYQHNFREIPPNITTNLMEDVEEMQEDEWYRWALNWKRTGRKADYEIRTGVFISESNYINSILDLNSSHNSFKNITEALATHNIFNNQKLTIGVNNNYTLGSSENFINTQSLNTSAFYLSHTIKLLKKIRLNTSVRQEYYISELKPITYSINAKYNFYKAFSLTTSFSKNYRTPTFNDLFWSGGYAKGNRNIEDEYGYSKDIGIEIKQAAKKTSIKSSISFYQNTINNQIQWIPEGQYWSPKNIKLVETIGVEYMLTLYYKIAKDYKLNVNLSYTYTDAQTKEKDNSESEDILNKQLIYIPFYQTNTLIGLSYKNISLNLGIQYVGYQFTRADNLDWIESYILNDIGIQYKLKFKKNVFILSGQANNVFDLTYEERQWYPMPGIHYTFGIKAILN